MDTDPIELIARLDSLKGRLQGLFELIGEEGIEDVLRDLKEAIAHVKDMSKTVERCHSRHGDDYEGLLKKADVSNRLAIVVHDMKARCPACRGPCQHLDVQSMVMRQLDSVMNDARIANVFNVAELKNG